MTGGLTEQMSKDLVARLMAKHGPDAPPEKAVAKAASVGHGFARILGGVFFLLLSMGIVAGLLILGRELGQFVQLALLAFAGVLGMFGLYYVVRGSNNTSGEALDELKAVGGMAGMFARMIRGKKNGDSS